LCTKTADDPYSCRKTLEVTAMLKKFALLTVALTLVSPALVGAADVGGGGLRKNPAHIPTHKPGKKAMHGILPGGGDSRNGKTGRSGTQTPH
jgi:hypothetical protein